MQITRPDYYKTFSCIAGDCPDTCCAGWQIMIDDKSLKKYRHVKGPFRNRLHNDIDWREQAFRQYDRRCAFLNKDNLCDLYTEIGGNMLCDTCRKYPRHIEEFEGLREYSLSLSCPEAARILLGKKEKVRFQTADIPSKEEVYDDFDYLLFTALMDTREYLLEILQNRSIPITLRMQKLLAVARDFQLCLNRNRLFEWQDICARHKASGLGNTFMSKVEKHLPEADAVTLIKDMWRCIVPEMEVLREDWPAFLKETLAFVYETDTAQYTQDYQNFLSACPDWSIQKEQLLVYWVYTYFCGAVYDGQIFAKAKMAVICTLLIQELSIGTFLKNKNPLSLEEQVSICYRFSRELEHSDLNLNALEELLDEKKLFSLGNLFRICR